jgi:hypothetical protein
MLRFHSLLRTPNARIFNLTRGLSSKEVGGGDLGYKEVERIVQSTSHRETLQLSFQEGTDRAKIKAAYLKLVKLVHPDVCNHPRFVLHTINICRY